MTRSVYSYGFSTLGGPINEVNEAYRDLFTTKVKNDTFWLSSRFNIYSGPTSGYVYCTSNSNGTNMSNRNGKIYTECLGVSYANQYGMNGGILVNYQNQSGTLSNSQTKNLGYRVVSMIPKTSLEIVKRR